MNPTERIEKLIAIGLASEVQMDELGLDGVLAAKAEGPQVLNYAHDVQPVGDSFRFLLSTEAPDRRGDIVRQAGLDVGNYRKNNVVLLNHDGEGLPIGTSMLVVDGPRTWMDVRFSDANPMARVVRGMTEEGTLKAASISLLPRKVDMVKEKERRAEMGLGKYGVVYEASEVLEGSIVTLPMNPEAVRGGLKVGVEKGLFSAEDADAFERVASPTERDLFRRIPGVSSSAATGTLEAPSTGTLEAPGLTRADIDRFMAGVERVERAAAAIAVRSALVQKNTEATRGAAGQEPATPGGGQQRYVTLSNLLERLKEE